MSKKSGDLEPRGLTIGYKQLGVININELEQAILTDIRALRDFYGILYVKSPRLKVFATNEYGDPLPIRRPEGGKIFYIDSFHYRPACKDYEL